MTTVQLPDAHALARRFAVELRSWLSVEHMVECIELNRVQTDPLVCHSHDHCDANMAMHAAWCDLTGQDEDSEDSGMQADNQTEVDLWDSAWDTAKNSGFDTNVGLPPLPAKPVTVIAKPLRVLIGDKAFEWDDEFGCVVWARPDADGIVTADDWAFVGERQDADAETKATEVLAVLTINAARAPLATQTEAVAS